MRYERVWGMALGGRPETAEAAVGADGTSNR